MASTRELDKAEAGELAEAIRMLDLTAPSGAVACGMDLGMVAIIVLEYPNVGDVGLWYHADGCQSLDNGRIGAWEVGNPSFYTGFDSVVDRLSPPIAV